MTIVALPRVSVIIPTHNHARFVTQAVDSALAQTCAALEVIVVDDGSVDDTRTRLARYGAQLRCIHQARLGVSAARNTGIRAAQGDCFVFLDADDRLAPDHLARQLPLLAARPECGLVYSGFQYIDESGLCIQGAVRPNRQGHLLKDLLRRRFFFPPGAAVVRRDCLERVGLFDESCPAAADTDLWIRIARAGYAFGYVDRPLFHYRVVGGSMSSRNAAQARDEFIRLDKFFADPDLADDIKLLKAEAYSVLYYEFAAKYFHAGDVEQGRDHIRAALSTCPTLFADKDWLLDWLAGYVLGPHAADPHQLIDVILDNLPSEAESLRSLRRQAHGRYHTAAAFSAYQSRDLKCVRTHILPALKGDPSIIRNRGFLRIAVESLLGRG